MAIVMRVRAVRAAIRPCEWETRARTSTRLEFDSTRTGPAAYSSISHGTRVKSGGDSTLRLDGLLSA